MTRRVVGNDERRVLARGRRADAVANLRRRRARLAVETNPAQTSASDRSSRVREVETSTP